jgi:multicomponent Na+:H+ antiporter subunit F
MGPVFAVTLVALVLAGLGCLARLIRGPSAFDRLAALDMLAVVVVSVIAVEAAWRGEVASVIVLATVVLLGFLGSLTVVRFAPGSRP